MRTESMYAPDKKWWARATRARDKLARLIGSNPDILSIDIVKDDTRSSDALILRVFVKTSCLSNIDVPGTIEGITICVIPDNP